MYYIMGFYFTILFLMTVTHVQTVMFLMMMELFQKN